MTHPAATALHELTEVVDWLTASLLPGTTKPYSAAELSADKQAEHATQARLAKAVERRNDTRAGMLIPLGETPAPMDLDVMDLLVDILEFTAPLSRLPAPSSAFDDPRPHLTAAASRIRRGQLHDLDQVLDGAVDLIERAHRRLGLIGDGQLLAAVCPWCAGRTASHPVGGARTMRVRAKLPAGKRTVAGVDPTDVRWYVTCENRACDPPPADCGERLRGRPAWPLSSEGDWLADRLERSAAS